MMTGSRGAACDSRVCWRIMWYSVGKAGVRDGLNFRDRRPDVMQRVFVVKEKQHLPKAISVQASISCN